MKFVNTNRTDNGEGKPLCTCIGFLQKNIHKIFFQRGENLCVNISTNTKLTLRDEGSESEED